MVVGQTERGSQNRKVKGEFQGKCVLKEVVRGRSTTKSARTDAIDMWNGAVVEKARRIDKLKYVTSSCKTESLKQQEDYIEGSKHGRLKSIFLMQQAQVWNICIPSLFRLHSPTPQASE